MNLDALKEKLKQEGFSNIFVWSDAPGAEYPDHTHQQLSAHIILNGEMSLTIKGETHVLKEGSRHDVPAGETHSAKMGPEGCTYLVGEK